MKSYQCESRFPCETQRNLTELAVSGFFFTTFSLREGSNSLPLDPKLDTITTRPRIQNPFDKQINSFCNMK